MKTLVISEKCASYVYNFASVSSALFLCNLGANTLKNYNDINIVFYV